MNYPNFLKYCVVVLAVLLGGSGAEAEQQPMTLEGLLDAVRQGYELDRQDNDNRLQAFMAEQGEREVMLREMIAERERLEALSASKEAEFEENELLIGDLEERLQDRMGSLKELFGVLQQVAGDAQAQFHGSLAQLDFPDRNQFLIDFAGRMGQANRLPALEEIERLWFELQREMTASSQVLSTEHTIVTSEGAEEQRTVTRIGLFNVVSGGRYLKFIPETGRLVEYPRQPSSRYLAGPQAIAAERAGLVPIAIDPVRGQLMDILTQAPNLSERVAQGGTIGYTIITLGLIGVLLAVWRLVVLLIKGRGINAQLDQIDQPKADNALGRILIAAREDDSPDVETLELRLSEAVLNETPSINAFVPLLKIIAAVAPLMGLLGTVTGMIITFQAITLFGAGDPRLMAGGISQALVTTVLGLCVAVPMLLLHNLVHMRARALTQVLQQKAVAVAARRAEVVLNGTAA